MKYLRIRSFVSVAALTVIVLAATPVRATDSPMGVGVMVGEPTGLAVKTWLTNTTAVDAGMAWSFSGETRLHFHADWLKHDFRILADQFGIEEGKLPLYYGIGGRMKFSDDTRMGIRFVVGVSYIFEREPFDVFFEVAPVMDIAPDTELNGTAFVGARFWF